MSLPRVCALCFAAATLAAPAVAQEPSADPASTPIRRIFKTLVDDVKRLPSQDSLTIAINGSVLALLAYPVDKPMTLGASSTRFLKTSFGTTGKLLGEEYVQGGSAVAAYVAGRLLGKPKLTRVGADLIEAQVLSTMLTQALKFSVQRTRPDGEARSFPSGHASASFATASVLHRHFGRRGAIPAYGAAVYITMSRLQANSHYASDILIGAALGMIAGRTATLDLAATRLHIAPVAPGGGAGFSVSLR